jgi:CheY-specific phosphatase CheX
MEINQPATPPSVETGRDTQIGKTMDALDVNLHSSWEPLELEY